MSRYYELLDMEFTQEFSNLYLRNNKTNGMKNLRCFPKCSNPHKSQGFCGQEITATFIIPINLFAQFNKLIFIGELRPKDADDTVEIIKSYEDATLKLLTKENNNNSITNNRNTDNSLFGLYLGCEIGERVITLGKDSNKYVNIKLSFNDPPKSWPYEWQNHRFRSETYHSFDITVISVLDSTNYEQLGVFSGPIFKVACKRRAQSNTSISNVESFCEVFKRKNSPINDPQHYQTDNSTESEDELIDQFQSNSLEPKKKSQKKLRQSIPKIVICDQSAIIQQSNTNSVVIPLIRRFATDINAESTSICDPNDSAILTYMNDLFQAQNPTTLKQIQNSTDISSGNTTRYSQIFATEEELMNLTREETIEFLDNLELFKNALLLKLQF